MSQHDFNIANQGFPAFRADLNNALGALATNSAGSTEPDTTFAYQYWYDETTNLLKMRNAADDAWITLAFFNQTNDEWEVRTAVIQAVDSAGVVIKTDDGITRIEIQDDGDVSIDSGTLFVDASANNVGIGTTSPNKQLMLSSTLNNDGIRIHGTANQQNPSVMLTNADTDAGFRINYNESLDSFVIGRTDVNGDFISNLATVDSSGNVGIGTTSPGAKLDVNGDIIADGIYLGGTGAANKLDDYEEGTWTATLRDSTGGTYTGAHGARYGFYTKIGNRVFFTGRWEAQQDFLTNGLNSGADLYLGDLPFTSQGTEQTAVTLQVIKADLNAGFTYHTAFVQINTTYIMIRELGDNTLANNLNVEDVRQNNSIVISGFYHTTA